MGGGGSSGPTCCSMWDEGYHLHTLGTAHRCVISRRGKNAEKWNIVVISRMCNLLRRAQDIFCKCAIS